MIDTTCPAVHAALQAGEKGVPFMPLRGLIGSDIVRGRPDWKLVPNPMRRTGEGEDPIVLLPALRPDVALFHAPWADRHGNVWVGRARELATMAHAARSTLVTVEEIVDGDLLADELTAPGAISSLYVSGIAVAPRGAWPLGLPDRYDADQEALAAYATAARDDDAFAAWVDRFVRDRAAGVMPLDPMLAALVRELDGCRTIAVGAQSPLPAAAALLVRAEQGARVLMLGNRALDQFSDGGRELFDLAGQGRIDAFFLSGGQIDGKGNINLLGLGRYPALTHRFPGSFGSAYLAHLVPRVILFREEHSPRTTPSASTSSLPLEPRRKASTGRAARRRS